MTTIHQIFCSLGLHQYGGNRQQTVHDNVVSVTEHCLNCNGAHIANYWRIQYEPTRKIKTTHRSVHRPTRPSSRAPHFTPAH